MDCSDDLFGGLPAVSKAQGGNAPTEAGSTTAESAITAKVDQPEAANDGVENRSEKRKEGASLVSSLGTAGTAMAFVPHAIRKKKKPTQQSQPQQQMSIKESIVGEKAIDSHRTKINLSIKDCNNSDKPSAELGTILVKSEILLGNSTLNASNECKGSMDNTHQNNEPYLENEPESLRLLHASVTHPYDPHFPNDYLAYRERKKTEQVRKDLQRSALQKLDQQEKLRKKIQEERKKIMESGDLDKIVESRAGEGVALGDGGVGGAVGRGRGRGRGVTNLPAWLLKKQQEQREAEAKLSSSGSKPTDGQFDDYAS